MKHGFAMTEWPFEKGLTVSPSLTSLDIEASPHRSEQTRRGDGGFRGCEGI